MNNTNIVTYSLEGILAAIRQGDVVVPHEARVLLPSGYHTTVGNCISASAAKEERLQEQDSEIASLREKLAEAQSDAEGRKRFEQWYKETLEERDQKTEECGFYLQDRNRLAGELGLANTLRDNALAERDRLAAQVTELQGKLDGILPTTTADGGLNIPRIIDHADELASQAEGQLNLIPYEQQSADVRHALIKLASARRGLADARAKLTTNNTKG